MMKKIEDPFNLSRFKNTQSLYYKDALEEIRRGRKETHWMWFIFPQLKALGFSDNAKYYGISSLEEAKAYMKDELLRNRLIEISQVLLQLESCDAESIFGWPDHMKLKSCMTLFEKAEPECSLFGNVIDKYFEGQRDEKTLDILQSQMVSNKDKFSYSEKDAAGCSVQSADFSQCEDCLFNNESAPHTCLFYKTFKPSDVIYDGNQCAKKRTE